MAQTTTSDEEWAEPEHSNDLGIYILITASQYEIKGAGWCVDGHPICEGAIHDACTYNHLDRRQV